MKSKVIIFTDVHKIEITEIDVPPPQQGQVLTKTILTGVSTGTETRVLNGKQDGAAFPIIPGYENVGEIVEVGEGVHLKPGTKAYVGSSDFIGDFHKCWGAQVEYALVNADQIIPIKEGINLADALYAKVGGIALHGIKRAKVTSKDSVAIVGMGLIGHLAAQSAKAMGATVIAIDMDEERLNIIKQAGADHVLNAAQMDIEKTVKELTNGGVTVAIDVTGIASTVDKTAQLVHTKPWAPPYPPSARVVILGSYTEPISFSYTESLFMNEPDILPSRDVVHDDLVDMLNLIDIGRVKPSVIPARQYKFNNAPQGYADLVNEKLMRIMFKW